MQNYVLIPLSPQAKMKNESDRARFLFVYMHKLACKHVYKQKTTYRICNIFICVVLECLVLI